MKQRVKYITTMEWPHKEINFLHETGKHLLEYFIHTELL